MKIVDLNKETKTNLLNDLIKRSPQNYSTYSECEAKWRSGTF